MIRRYLLLRTDYVSGTMPRYTPPTPSVQTPPPARLGRRLFVDGHEFREVDSIDYAPATAADSSRP